MSEIPVPPPERQPLCPICSKPTVDAHRPFCSPRCRQIDLGRWLKGSYAIPVVEEDGADRDD